jgi:hypothetical protein
VNEEEIAKTANVREHSKRKKGGTAIATQPLQIRLPKSLAPLMESATDQVKSGVAPNFTVFRLYFLYDWYVRDEPLPKVWKSWLIIRNLLHES